jgi:histidine triad (HIT) family protein
MVDCVFCKIVKGEIKSYTVYEDNTVKAILDINPINEGHTLVIPKDHYTDIFDIDEKVLKDIISAAKRLAKKYKTMLNADGVNLVQSSGEAAQQEVPHFHLHIVPRYKGDGLNIWFHKERKKEIDLDKVFERLK